MAAAGERYLVLKGLAGLGDRLATLARALQLAVATGRTLVIDWTDASWCHDDGGRHPHGFWHYFDLSGLPAVCRVVRGDAETQALLRSWSAAGVATAPASFRGACHRVDYLLRGGRLCLDADPIGLPESVILTAQEPVVFYLAYCSGQLEDVLPYLRFRDPPGLPAGGSSIRATIGVHFRNTDKANSLTDVLQRTEHAWRPGRSVWLATDDLAAIEAFRTRFGADLQCQTPPPRPVAGGGIHHATAAELAAVGLTKEGLNWAMLRDVVRLRDCVLFVDCPNSLFSRVVHGLRSHLRRGISR